MKYLMPTFETADGWIAVANQKNYISVYTCSTDKIAPYTTKHPKTKCGKGCLNFRDSQEIDFGALAEVIRLAL